MRYICHANGCDLVFSSVKEKAAFVFYRSMLSRFLFDVGT